MASGTVVLIGNPNVGKSALFGALTGAYATVSNYPGTTVELSRGTASADGGDVTVVDTPGTASFLPLTEDERVARDVLLEGGPRAVVVVADAKNLQRALVLVLELAEMEIPLVLCLNMMDEAEERGLHVDTDALAAALGIEVVPTVATRGHGVRRLWAALPAARPSRATVRYPAAVEDALVQAAALLPPSVIPPRALALMALGGDGGVDPWLRGHLAPAVEGRLASIRQGLAGLEGPVAYVLARARQDQAGRLATAARRPASTVPRRRRWVEGLERLTTHRVWGFPILGAVLAAMYAFVGVFGAGTLVDLLEEGLFGRYVNPLATRAAGLLPWAFLRDLLVGPYGVVTMALTYALALVLPIVGTFFVAFGVLEDSGYLPRLAVMVDRVFRKMGLNGKAVLPMVLGLGCDTMATLSTRILETPKERLIVILLLALGVPCSAQLAVVLTLLHPLPAAATLLWAAVVLGALFAVGRLAALVLPGRAGDFILELPPLRLPRLGNIASKTLARVEWYLKEAVPLFVLGTLLLFGADRAGLLGALERLGQPVVSGLLGLPREAAGSFLVGFLRRDFGAAGLYRLAEEGRLDAVQALVAAVTITLFIPCIANVFMIVKERGWRTAALVAGFVLPLAVAVGAALGAVLRAFPGILS